MSKAVPLSAIKKAVLDGIVDAAGAAGERFGMWLNEFPRVLRHRQGCGSLGQGSR